MTIQPLGVLSQTAPLSDSVVSNVSDTYLMQLNCSGATPPITWTTTAASPALLVSPGGVVGTTMLLGVGAYTSSGSMVDHAGNSGIWSFTLSVITQVAPQTSVTPVTPLPWTGIEILVPFQINAATGMVASVQDYRAILEQHVVSILMTSPGERVMLPDYGAGLEQQVFQPITDLTSAELQAAIEEKLARWESGITLVSVEVNADPNNDFVLNVTVTFTATPFAGLQTLTLNVGGGLPALPTSEIGPFL